MARVFLSAALIGATLASTPLNAASTDEQDDHESISTDFLWRGVRFSPDGRYLAACGSATFGGGGRLVLWDVANQKMVHAISAPGGFTCVAFSPDGRYLATGVLGGEVAIWDTRSGKSQRSFQGHRCGPSTVCFSPDGKTLVSAAKDNMVRVWDVAAGKPKATFRFRYADRLYDPSTYGEMAPERPHERASVDVTFNDAIQTIYEVAFSPDGNLIAVSPGVPAVVPVIDVQKGKIKFVIDTKHEHGTTTAAFSPDGKFLVTGGCHGLPAGDATLRFWNIQNGKQSALKDFGEPTGKDEDFRCVTNATRCLRYGASGKLLFIGMPFAARICRADTNEVISTISDGDALDMAFSPDGKLAVTVDGKLRCWDVATGKERELFRKMVGGQK